MAAWPDLDRTDFEILRLLQKDARLTNKELASAVELAPSSTHERVKRLWEVGVLRGLHAEVDLHALGIGIEALLMVELSKHKRSNVDAFMQGVGVSAHWALGCGRTCRGPRYGASQGPRTRQIHQQAGRHPHRNCDHLRRKAAARSPLVSGREGMNAIEVIL
jgi:hypothetical protein